MNRLIKSILFNLILISVLVSCKRQTLGVFSGKSDKEHYLNQLTKSGIDQTIMGKRWLEAGVNSLENPAHLDIPASVRGAFKSKSVQANAWEMSLQKGATLKVVLRWESQDSSRVFLDIIEAETRLEELTATSLDSMIEFEAAETGLFFIRIQPELLAEGNYELVLEYKSTYAVFPVLGKTSAAIQSFWGVDRDGGRRSHEGIDIFAERGTPVVAPVSGVIGSVKETGIGGKQVWLRDTQRGWNLYFAHLDSQTVSIRERVIAGDTLGFVGNTGNAITTSPHLHFGIYSSGAFDPYPVVKDNYTKAVAGDLALEHKMMVVSGSSANLRQGPSTKFESLLQLEAATPVWIESAVGEWYQVRTLTGMKGFLYASLLSAMNTTAISESDSYVFRNPFSTPTDSIYLTLDNFVKIGSHLDFDLIMDQDENLYFIPSR